MVGLERMGRKSLVCVCVCVSSSSSSGLLGDEQRGDMTQRKTMGEQTNESVRYHEQSSTNEAYLLQASAGEGDKRRRGKMRGGEAWRKKE